MSASPPAPTPVDRVVVAVLVLALVVIAGAIVAPGRGPTAAVSPPPPSAPGTSDRATPSSAPTVDRPIRIGLLGPATSVNPLTVASGADRDLAALVFSGLVALGPDQTIVPDLATRWTTADDGRTWTFRLRNDATWHDGEPVTAADVVFTVEILRDDAYDGPGAASWRDVTATAVDERTVRFELSTPIGGFLQAATQRIVPQHLLRDVPIDRLSDDPFNRAPVGSGRYRLEELTETAAALAPSDDPEAPNLDVRFYPDATALADAWDAEDLDVIGDLTSEEALRLAGTPESRLVRYPTTTFTTVLFNLRPSRPEFRDPRVRTALLRAIDRTGLIEATWDGQAVLADAPIHRVSWAFDPAASRNVAYDRRGAAAALADAGWTPDDGVWRAPGASGEFKTDLLSPDVATNPGAFLAAASVAASWQRIGLTVTHVALPANELVAERLQKGDFLAAVVDINVGLDPDLYPLLASSQTLSTGVNVSGLVDAQLDALLESARAPGTEEARKARYKALQERLAAQQYLLPLAFRDELFVVRDTVEEVDARQIGGPGDRFWDVLTWRLADDR